MFREPRVHHVELLIFRLGSLFILLGLLPLLPLSFSPVPCRYDLLLVISNNAPPSVWRSKEWPLFHDEVDEPIYFISGLLHWRAALCVVLSSSLSLRQGHQRVVSRRTLPSTSICRVLRSIVIVIFIQYLAVICYTHHHIYLIVIYFFSPSNRTFPSFALIVLPYLYSLILSRTFNVTYYYRRTYHQ